METQEWIDGAFEETDTDYTIAGMNILYKEETDILSFYFDGTNYFGVASLAFDTPSP